MQLRYPFIQVNNDISQKTQILRHYIKLVNLDKYKYMIIRKHIIALALLLLVNIDAFSQNEISIQFRNIPLVEAIDKIDQHSEYTFFYDPGSLNLKQKVSLNADNMSIDKAITQMLATTNVDFEIKNNQIVLLAKSVNQTKQNEITVSGRIQDEQGEPLIGVNIKALGTTVGTITDVDGAFTLDILKGASLEVSYIGYQTEIVLANSSKPISIVLKEDKKILDEVVVIGYGAIKKRDLTGSVGSVKGSVVAERGTTQLSSALQGALSGVMVTRDSGAPGSGGSIRIRGITTMSDNDPLVIVDGVPTSSLNDINAQDVEDITVLKDAASASIYGARAAAGVILVTTKRAGSEELSLSYTYEYGLDIPTKSPKYVGVERFMEMTNELRWNDAGNGANRYPTYSKDVIDNYSALHLENPDKYPNTDWRNLILKSKAVRQSHMLSIAGGSKFVKTKVSIVYDNLEGLFKNKDYERYSVRLNNDVTISPMLSAAVDLNLKLSKYKNPAFDPLYDMRLSPPIYPAIWSNGGVAEGKSGNNPYAALEYGGTSKNDYYNVGGRMSLDFKPIKGLIISGVIAPNFSFDFNKRFQKRIPYFSSENPSQELGTVVSSTNLSESRNKSKDIVMQFIINYNKTIAENHSLNLMAGYESRYFHSDNMGASRENYELDSYPYLDRGPLEMRSNYGGASESAYRSYFGRVIYGYMNKYLLQANVRHDGSSRFASGHRWGTFPSVSLGWVLSEEDFMPKDGALSFSKLRVSWGSLGNERIGNYPYQALLTFYNSLFYKGDDVVSNMTAAQVQYAIDNITWETTESFNLGLDLSFFNNKLRFSGDYFYKKTKDMLLKLEIPGYVGYDNPDQNAGKMNTKGYEFDLSWDDNIGALDYGISLNMSDFVSKMGDLKGTQFLGDQVKMKGSQFNEWRGYLSDGLFKSQEELDNYPTVNNAVKVGDIKFKDVSGPNGEPDGVINDYDKVLLGGSLPRYLYGGNIRLGYKGIDFSVAFQGVGKQNARLQRQMVQPLSDDWGNMPKIIDGNYWSHFNNAKQNEKARYPRLTYANAGYNNSMSDFWIFNGKYFRLKNITLGYTLPQSLSSRAKINKLRFYITANDLFSIDNYPSGWDPEMGVSAYPITTSVIFGVSVNF